MRTRALPDPEFVSRAVEYRAPSTPAEQLVAAVFADVLGVDRVGIDWESTSPAAIAEIGPVPGDLLDAAPAPH
ncbi:hypothetical protein C8K36_101249 [Rhodococcus sp. OK519]|uniref:hypothetical protein n=1 Tax=Rhodococcus sp. OK519 TaxID=2135729 RepID=UPI000D37000E|nr:hypothetical protein C8K36_101249 [Rhodococcus sp. OK519]